MAKSEISLRVFCIAVAVVLFTVSIYFLGEIRGIETGSSATIALESVGRPPIVFAAHGPNVYTEFSIAYGRTSALIGLYISACLYFLLSKEQRMRPGVHLTFVGFLLVGAFISVLASMPFQNEVVQSEFIEIRQYKSWLRRSVTLNWILCGSFLILLLVEVGIFFRSRLLRRLQG